MNIETNRTKLKWYEMPHWRWTGPGGYYGGSFAGLGLGIMLVTGPWFDLVEAHRDYIFGAGVAIFVITNLVCYYLEARRYDKNHGKKDA